MTAVERYINTFVPEHYDLFLDINRVNKTFEGRVQVTGEALTSTISLHQKDLTIHKVEVAGAALPFTQENEKDAVHIELGQTGEQELVLTFSGRIADKMTGIYPSYYTLDGVQKEVISTQFESHFAREAFPCVDEPEAKATFDLAIRFDAGEGELVLANMPEIAVEERQKTGIWRFDTTPRMSSYLLAFAIGDLHGQTAKTKNGTEVGVFATRAHSLDKTDFALDIATRVIEFYEDYFGVKYPIPLSYHVALPDFSAGAMENWGLVTYREVYLLADSNSTVSTRRDIATVIAHEVAHQWFGNLVTMAWWDDLWLNESFAMMMENLSLDRIEPDWKVWETFQTRGVPAALNRDATDGVQSVHVAVNHPDEINTLFDGAIVYAKGSRLMVMLHRWLGDDAFRNGLRSYFARYQYQNTVGQNLWDCLAEASGKDVAGLMTSWIEQPGYPLVTAKVENDELVLTQQQFFIGEHEDKGRLWVIPLNSNWTGLPDTLSERELRLPGFAALAKANSGALRLNTQNTGHYLTNYEGQLLDAVLADLPDLDPISKRQIVLERQFLADSGQISTADLVPLLPLLSQDSSYLVTSAVGSILEGLTIFLEEGSSLDKTASKLWHQAFVPLYERLGWEPKPGESDEEAILRQRVLNALVTRSYQPACEEASRWFAAYQDRLDQLPAHLRVAVLLNQMISSQSLELMNQFFDLYVTTTDTAFRYDLLAAICRIRSEEGIRQILDRLTDKDQVKPQDLMTWYANLLRRPQAQDLAWTWARDKWEWIKQVLGGDMAFEGFVTIPAAFFRTADKLASYKAFFEPQLSDMALSRSIGMGIKEIAASVDLIAKDQVAVQAAIMKAVGHAD